MRSSLKFEIENVENFKEMVRLDEDQANIERYVLRCMLLRMVPQLWLDTGLVFQRFLIFCARGICKVLECYRMTGNFDERNN